MKWGKKILNETKSSQERGKRSRAWNKMAEVNPNMLIINKCKCIKLNNLGSVC